MSAQSLDAEVQKELLEYYCTVNVTWNQGACCFTVCEWRSPAVIGQDTPPQLCSSVPMLPSEAVALSAIRRLHEEREKWVRCKLKYAGMVL